MGNGSLAKIKAATAAEICAHFTLAGEWQRFVKEGVAPRGFLEALVAKKQYATAVDFLAHALPAREAVWWGCLCVQHACGATLTPPEKAACRAAAQWVLEPTEQHRSAAKAPGEAAGATSPAGALAAAALQTGGNLAPPKAPPLPPPPYAPAKAVATAVKLAATKSDPARIAQTLRLYVGLGLGVADGRVVWPEVSPGARGRG